jgi:hypothetical protein
MQKVLKLGKVLQRYIFPSYLTVWSWLFGRLAETGSFMNFNLINTPAGSEPAIPTSERPQPYAFDRAVTGIGFTLLAFVCLYHT